MKLVTVSSDATTLWKYSIDEDVTKLSEEPIVYDTLEVLHDGCAIGLSKGIVYYTSFDGSPRQIASEIKRFTISPLKTHLTVYGQSSVAVYTIPDFVALTHFNETQSCFVFWGSSDKVIVKAFSKKIVVYDTIRQEEKTYQMENRILNVSIAPKSNDAWVVAVITSENVRVSYLHMFGPSGELRTKHKFVAQSFDIRWRHDGRGLLISAQDAGASKATYYGSTILTLLQSPNWAPLMICKPEDQLYEFAWVPFSRKFIVCVARDKNQIVLYEDGKPKSVLGSGKRNMLRFTSDGAAMLVGGFGNLPGHFNIWDLGTLRCVADTQVPWAVTCEWCPNAPFLLAATTAPRLRVDNCIKILDLQGKVVYVKEFDELTLAKWVPSNASISFTWPETRFKASPFGAPSAQAPAPKRRVIPGL